jgi:NitT/TauT family transport system substrate-binding protein
VQVKHSVILSVLVAVALGLSACGDDDDDDGGSAGGGSGSTEEISFVQPVPGSQTTFFYQFFVGQELGYFEEEGIRLTAKPASDQIPITGFVQNGNVDVGATGDEEVLPAAAQGGGFKVVYDAYNRTGEAISAPVDSDIRTVADLEGKTVGLAAQDDRTFLQEALSTAGVDPGSVQTPTVGRGGPPVAEALESGRIDAYASGISYFAIVQGVGAELRNITPEELLDRRSASFVVSTDIIEEREDALAGFMRAWAKASYVGEVNRDVVAAIARQEVPTEWKSEEVGNAILDVVLESTAPEGDTFGQLGHESWEKSQQNLLDAGVYDNAVDLDTLLDDRFIERANDWDRAEVEADVEQWANDHPDQLGG